MSKYTTEVRFICETAAGLSESEGYNSIDDILDDAYDNIFDFQYPIFDANYKKPLETKILKHFYTREICEETVGLWKLRLADKMNIIMPYYNQLYKSELYDFNPLYDTDYVRSHSTAKNENSVSNNATNSKSSNAFASSDNEFNAYSDTPQGTLDNVVSNAYLTNATKDEKAHISSSSNEGSVTGNMNEQISNLEQYVEHVSGNMGYTSFSKRINEFRTTFLNIDKQIIDELETLFFGLW